SPPFVVGLWPRGFDSVLACRRVRRGAFSPARPMSLTQRFVERERAVGGAGDAQVPNRAHGHERGKRLVIAQTSARLGVEMHRRAPPAREQKGVAIARSPAEADRFDASSPND